MVRVRQCPQRVRNPRLGQVAGVGEVEQVGGGEHNEFSLRNTQYGIWRLQHVANRVFWLLIPKLQTIVMERITHPRGAHPERREGLVILQPNFFILQRVRLSQFSRKIPRQRINLPALLHILDDDREICLLA